MDYQSYKLKGKLDNQFLLEKLLVKVEKDRQLPDQLNLELDLRVTCKYPQEMQLLLSELETWRRVVDKME